MLFTYHWCRARKTFLVICLGDFSPSVSHPFPAFFAHFLPPLPGHTLGTAAHGTAKIRIKFPRFALKMRALKKRPDAPSPVPNSCFWRDSRCFVLILCQFSSDILQICVFSFSFVYGIFLTCRKLLFYGIFTFFFAVGSIPPLAT